jgi:peptide/nickel transport system ATP-binding protein
VVRYLCSRVLVMRAGVVVEEGLTEEVFSNPRDPYTRTLIDAVPSDDASVRWPPVAFVPLADKAAESVMSVF